MPLDASRDFEAGKKQAQLLDEHVEKIIEVYRARASRKRYSYKATSAKLKQTVSISTYLVMSIHSSRNQRSICRGGQMRTEILRAYSLKPGGR
jgi:type I restriction-modification system DNA methylase subunit